MSRILHIKSIATIVLGCLFLFAGIFKLFNSGTFFDAVTKLRGIPAFAIPIISVALPLFEILLGFSIIARLRYSLKMALIANGLFLGIIVYNLFLGNNGVDCGCFGNIVESKVDGISLARQTSVIIINIALLFSGAKR